LGGNIRLFRQFSLGQTVFAAVFLDVFCQYIPNVFHKFGLFANKAIIVVL
jgi:hypothetical protein